MMIVMPAKIMLIMNVMIMIKLTIKVQVLHECRRISSYYTYT